MQALRQRGQALDKTGQATEQLCAAAFQCIQRPVATQQWRSQTGQLRRRGKAQQQAIQPLPPGKRRIRRQAQLLAVCCITAPAHAGVAQPVAQQRQVFRFNADPSGDGRLLQPGEDFLGGKAAVWQRQQIEEGFNQRDFRAQAAIGQAEGNTRHALARGKDRFDIGCVTLNVRG